ncbi:hypothetical protein GobsT_62540 [Gemmata obscuriglobus]|uniref:TIGR02996 domain-containing protein n=1 Tax=Gemmata obscuriglobus TaxID=114 RepID=A0A2Z3GP13_9BACT|nr:TIGR02996 domain-containing protein [Gemmata obscuriglobus]AWM35999.1 TIGR02996 domain-containing protein [Gemmata obscuriglobus]QEG31432.1 hypothetical protein GobsT_62540 [Gemmata obscuriglobus]VTS10774.1 unnamed protein product [Gemmata obscuriglobus UQM 2246]
MTADERGFLATLDTNPNDHTARAAYADWLDEQGRRYEAAIERGRAGLSEVYFKIRRKSDGLFSEGRSPSQSRVRWSAKGKTWRRMNDVRAHMLNLKDGKSYGGTPWNDIEVVLHEVRVVFTAALPVSVANGTLSSRGANVIITEPNADHAEG